MGYSGARGGLAAILAAEDLVRRARDHAPVPWASVGQIVARFRLAVDRVMGEAGLFDEDTAAAAFRQAEGDSLEAAHILRAHRSTLPRLAVSEPVDPDEMVMHAPHRARLSRARRAATARPHDRLHRAGFWTSPPKPPRRRPTRPPAEPKPRTEDQRRPRRFLGLLRELGLAIDHRTGEDPEPFDIARVPARPPAPRSAALAAMARAETGALVALWYRSILGPDGDIHEVTLGEVRHGRLPLRVKHPHTGEPVTIGQFRATEAEAIEDLDGAEEDRSRFDVGYGLCFGHNERKAIAMANLDIANRRFGRSGPLEQLLLLTTDGLDSGGFLEHLKLPHYVTFRSMVERKQALQTAMADWCRPGRAGAGAGRKGLRMTSTAELLTEATDSRCPDGTPRRGRQAGDPPGGAHRRVRAGLPGALRLARNAGGPRLGLRRAAGDAGGDRRTGHREGDRPGRRRRRQRHQPAPDDRGDDGLRRVGRHPRRHRRADPAPGARGGPLGRRSARLPGAGARAAAQVEKSVAVCARMHAEGDYAAMWVSLYEDIVRNGVITAVDRLPGAWSAAGT